jgi:glycosyltransferase involved in cell wall biosynthesis
MPTVTVLVPSYNQAVFLEECLRSILNQNYPNLEVLLADGGSQDHSIKIIDYYRPYLTWAVSEPDRGTWDADNKALARATGEYIIVVNSDDLLLKNGLFYLLDTLLKSDGHHWATGKVRAINRAGETKAVFKPKPPAYAPVGRTFLTECWIYHPSTIVRKSLIGQFAELDVMDWEVWIRLEREGLLPAISPCQVAALRFHTDCKSFNSAGIYDNYLKLLRSIANLYPDHLTKEITKTTRSREESLMIEERGRGRRNKSMLRWLKLAIQHPTFFFDRPYLGLGKRLYSGNLGDIYRPMAFLEKA